MEMEVCLFKASTEYCAVLPVKHGLLVYKLPGLNVHHPGGDTGVTLRWEDVVNPGENKVSIPSVGEAIEDRTASAKLALNNVLKQKIILYSLKR